MLDANVWRELVYYEYVREQILKKYKCPNFIMLYAYYTANNVNIDFEKIKLKNYIKNTNKQNFDDQ